MLGPSTSFQVVRVGWVSQEPYLCCECLYFAKEGILVREYQVIFCIFPLHDGTAVRSRQLSVLGAGIHHQFGILIL